MSQLAQLIEHLGTAETALDETSFPAPSEASLIETLRYLESSAAADSIATDPYWPKWDSPWWRMTLLVELGLADRIPRPVIDLMTKTIGEHYLDFFPLKQEDVPPGADTYTDVVCHCALGTIYKVLSACNVDVDRSIPWARQWFVKYQLRDGGLNCDESAYTKSVPKSSIVSTLAPMEAMLSARDPLTPAEEQFLDSGADYLIRRRLCRSVSKGMNVIDLAWLRPTFPRFYHYDVLRGLSFLVKWARWRRRALPGVSVHEAVSVLSGTLDGEGRVCVARRAFDGHDTLARGDDGVWRRGFPAKTFPLLEEVSRIGAPCSQLTHEWRAAISGLKSLADGGLLP